MKTSHQYCMILALLHVVLLSTFSSCSDDNDEQAEYIQYTIAGHKNLVSYFLELPSYIITDKNGVVTHALTIKGIEDVYEEGNQYEVVLKRTVRKYKEYEEIFDIYNYELTELISSKKEDESTQYLNYTVESFKRPWTYEDKTIETYLMTDENGYTEQPISIKGFDEIYEEGQTYTVKLKRTVWKQEPYEYLFNYYAFELVEVIQEGAN